MSLSHLMHNYQMVTLVTLVREKKSANLFHVLSEGTAVSLSLSAVLLPELLELKIYTEGERVL